MSDLISVVVPVYNVDRYVSKCLDSIINQTYKNLEIIVINDGSSDNSLNICKEYANKDNRIIVLDQDNCGLSETRNRGINIASGKYIGFIDSDDVISPYMFEYLYKAITENNSDISICGCDYFARNPCFDTLYKVSNINCIDALKELMIDRKITNHAVDKLYKKNLFDSIKFPVGKKYEDICVMYRLFLNCNSISFINCKLYGYYQRVGSITGEYNINTTIDFINAINNRYYSIIDSGIDIYPYLDMNRVNSILRYFLDIVKYKKIDVIKSGELSCYLDYEIKLAKKIFTNDVRKVNSKKRNFLIKILFINKYLFYYIMTIYSKIFGAM